MFRFNPFLFVGLTLLLVNVANAQDSGQAQLERQVRDTEQAFADSMADRDFEAFASFLADEAVFFSGDLPLRGKEAVAAAWQAYFEGPDAQLSGSPGKLKC